eukprot:TRINITY_DN10783_c0_g1_i2.p1 TRINITY_DN10783_c0_g1~~TRINITY_DN10783_c0_g1_i2.p1  ORF type:complete len:245 (+),score=64.33 TRINITY_DN10783_c0_g1_i2:77-811(+)
MCIRDRYQRRVRGVTSFAMASDNKTAAAQMAGNLEVTPGELAFQVVVGDYSKRQMRLNNKGTKPMAYKIKTTNPHQYFVRPNQGVVKPGEKTRIAVMMGKLPAQPTEKCRDKFLVQATEYDGPIPDDNDKKFDWHTNIDGKDPKNKIYDCKLKCVYVQPRDGAAGAAAAVSDNKSQPEGQTGGQVEQPKPERSVSKPAPPVAMAQEMKPVSSGGSKHSWSVYLVIAFLFFIVGRFTHHLELPGM